METAIDTVPQDVFPTLERSNVFSQAKLSALSMDFFRVPARNFSGFRHGRAAATFLTFPA